MKEVSKKNTSNKRSELPTDFQQINGDGDIYEQMFKYSVISIIIHDMEMNIINVNDSAVDQFGYSYEELLAKSIFELHTPEELDHSVEVLNEMRQKEKLSVETSFKRKDGSVFAAEATPCKFIIGDKPVIHVFIKDITARKKAERELEAYIKEISNKNKELEQFTYITSHDLQEPLNSIIGWSSLLRKNEFEKLGEIGTQSIEIIEKSAVRMKNFITSLLEYSKLGREKEKSEVQVSELLNNLELDLSDLIQKEKVTLHFLGKDIKFKAYESSLIQLFQNIIVNAIKYKKENVPPVIEIKAEELPEMYQFSISDNGIGIAEEHYGKIFEIFQRLHTRDKIEGTGIGLSHCKKIVNMHGGTIWVESEVSKGTTFYFTLSK
ncbi:PAS domain S-box protein [Flavobacterium jejuense]|uniref:histidine kinase n=1 Tax=Flavobacterium jejuense TaxID=1544455 RepID=A0ABX0IS24_9FLAO|nr:PAS domain-containing sensor histidine kinase [Flavobacterium jejuense]NHN26328.1 PAS domain S-box protein [Flavobacterium jejuense]